MATIAITTTVLTGCSQVIKTGANVALGFTEKHIVPPILAMDDAEMVCNSGNSLTPAIMATKEMGAVDPGSHTDVFCSRYLCRAKSTGS